MSKNKYIKFEWAFKPDAIPRMFLVEEDTILDNEFISSFEYNSENKILKAYYYEPVPQYLILSITNLLKNGTSISTLILTLTTTLTEKDNCSSAILKIFGLCRENEFVYDVIRSTCLFYCKEHENSLFFFEDAKNEEGEPISILKLLFNIISAYHVNVYDSETDKFDHLKIFFEN
jgi:hypothetical protein